MIVFDIELSSPCNAKCDFCPQSFNPTGVKRDIKFLDKKIILSVMNQIKEICKIQDGVIVDFCGMGENLLRKDLLWYSLELLTEDRPKNLDIRLTTNGYFLTEEVTTNPLFHQLNQIEISLAHTLNKEKYEAIYNINYDRVKKNVMEVKQNYPGKVIIASVRVKQLEKDMLAFDNFWDKYVDKFLVHDFHTRGNSYPHPNPKTKDLWRFDICGVFKHFVYISSDALILPCCNDVRGEHPIGDLRKETILEIIDKKKIIQKENVGYDMCVGCDGGEQVCNVFSSANKNNDSFDMPELENL